MNLKKQIIGIFKKKQEIKTEQKELTERIEKALYDTVGEKGITPRPITIPQITYTLNDIQIYLESHRTYGMELCDLLRFINELGVPYKNVCIDYGQWGKYESNRDIMLRIKLTEEATRK